MLQHLKSVDDSEVVALRVPGQHLPPLVCHLLFALREAPHRYEFMRTCSDVQLKLPRPTRGMKKGSLKLRDAAMVRTGSRQPSRAPNRISLPM